MAVGGGVMVGKNGCGRPGQGRKFDVSLFVPTPHPMACPICQAVGVISHPEPPDVQGLPPNVGRVPAPSKRWLHATH